MLKILSMEQWLAVGKEIHARFGLNPSINDAQGRPLVANTVWANELCPAIRGGGDGAAEVCLEAGRHFARVLRETGKPMIEECGAGMLRIAVPVVVDDLFMGSLGGCGKVCDGGEVDEFMIRKATGLSMDDIRGRAGSVASITWGDADEIVDYLEERVRALPGN
ncbi:PocR ligand-binding domain-containing protein [Desulfovibrio aminophilus]|nr:PocR ligand-binding domain-containing protein [Desulfovibrio aminophilus]MCM0753995.1 PocR ligand-binding domain-containing protein [Desulfovibrio aminophilus]